MLKRDIRVTTASRTNGPSHQRIQVSSWAFAILSKAANKAISAGKAREMLERLESDKTAFPEAVPGAAQWMQLQETLKKKLVTECEDGDVNTFLETNLSFPNLSWRSSVAIGPRESGPLDVLLVCKQCPEL